METAPHAWWFLTSTTGQNPCAGLQKLPGTHFLTGFTQRAENMIWPSDYYNKGFSVRAIKKLETNQ